MKRRNFLKMGAGAVAGAPLVFSKSGRAYAQSASKIVVASNPNASTFSAGSVQGKAGRQNIQFTTDAEQIYHMIDQSILSLTGQASVGAAWESLFPSGQLTTSTKIGIKMNMSIMPSDRDYTGTYNDWVTKKNPYAAKVEVIDGIVSGLTQMLGGTFPAGNITVTDKHINGPGDYTTYGYDVQMYAQQGMPARAMYPYVVSSTDEDSDINYSCVDMDDMAGGTTSFQIGPSNDRVTVYITPPVDDVDFLINLCIPKDHWDAAGYSGAIKNLFGCIKNCWWLHAEDEGWGEGPGAQDYGLLTNYENINSNAPIVLHVMDAIAGLYDDGPNQGWAFHQNEIAMSADPLTTDYYGLQLVNAARVANGLHNIVYTSSSTNSDGHLNCRYLKTASDEGFGNLNNDDKQTLDQTGIKGPDAMPSLDKAQARLLNLQRYAGGWRTGVLMDASGRNHTIRSRIVDVRGREVRSFPAVSTRSSRHYLDWDGKNNRGATVAAGFYGWQIHVDQRKLNQNVIHY